MSSELLKGTRLQIRRAEYDSAEYCHWTFPDDDPAQVEPSYMMARRLKPRANRGTHVVGGALERWQSLMLAERPPVRPNGKRAAFIQAIEDAKAATEERNLEREETAWHQVGRTLTLANCSVLTHGDDPPSPPRCPPLSPRCPGCSLQVKIDIPFKNVADNLGLLSRTTQPKHKATMHLPLPLVARPCSPPPPAPGASHR
jgi:hypothetical protein